MAVPARVATRLMLAGTIVAALFLMHGPSATPGCPGGVAMTTHPSTETGADTVMGGMAGADQTANSASRLAVAERDVGGGHGQVCMSTPPRWGLPALLALLLLVGWSDAGRLRFGFPAPAAGRRRRAPPPHGAALLLTLGVSRT